MPIIKHDSEVVPEEDAEAEDAMNSADTMFYLIDEAMFMCGGGDPLELLKTLTDFKDSIFRELEEPLTGTKNYGQNKLGSMHIQ